MYGSTPQSPDTDIPAESNNSKSFMIERRGSSGKGFRDSGNSLATTNFHHSTHSSAKGASN